MGQVTEQEMGTLLSIISRADNAQLSRVNLSVASRRQVISRVMICQMRIGAKVKWNGKHGPQDGIVKKVKQKYVEVQVSSGLIWNVPAAMLTVVP
jgi:sRNA-binding protein